MRAEWRRQNWQDGTARWEPNCIPSWYLVRCYVVSLMQNKMRPHVGKVFRKVKIQGKDEDGIFVSLEKMNSVGWAALTVTFLQLVPCWPLGRGETWWRGQCLPLSATTGTAVPFASIWQPKRKEDWCGDPPSIKGKRVKSERGSSQYPQ